MSAHPILTDLDRIARPREGYGAGLVRNAHGVLLPPHVGGAAAHRLIGEAPCPGCFAALLSELGHPKRGRR